MVLGAVLSRNQQAGHLGKGTPVATRNGIVQNRLGVASQASPLYGGPKSVALIWER